MKLKPRETDMYPPIKRLLESQGFIVRGEVNGCDIAASREGALWIVEMKLSANLTMIYQAMNRQQTTNSVFVAIPRPTKLRGSNYKNLTNLLRKLGIGLITVALDSPMQYAEIVFFPDDGKIKNGKNAHSIKKELLARTVDTVGGNSKAPINTAYRERCIELVCLLEVAGPSSPASLKAMTYDTCASLHVDISRILNMNVYGWFNKLKRGVYEISHQGREYIELNKSSPLVAFYKMKAQEAILSRATD